MADDKKKEDSTANKAAGTASRVKEDFLDEVIKDVGEGSASAVFRTLSPEIKAWLSQHSRWLKLARAIRFLTPNKITSEFVSEFVANFQKEAAGHKPAATEQATTKTADEFKTAVDVMIAVDALPAAQQHSFSEWYLADEAHFAGFNRMAKGVNKQGILGLIRRPQEDREQFIARFKEERRISYVQLKAAIEQDPRLMQKVTAFLTRLNAAGVDRTQEFWGAVERRAFGKVEEFGSVMNLNDELILQNLKIPSKTVGQRVEQVIATVTETAKAVDTQLTKFGVSPKGQAITQFGQNVQTKLRTKLDALKK